MTKNSGLRIVFWATLAAFLVWDWSQSAPINLRQEAPLIAAGSGHHPAGGHCSMPE